MSGSAGNITWRVAFELSPIILVDGIAKWIPGHMLPIIAVTEAAHFPAGLLAGGTDFDVDNAFAHFRPLPGSTLINQQVAHYPFANNDIAANAVIKQPRLISFQMTCPARGNFSYFTKLPVMTALNTLLELHTDRGGTYTLVTPSAVFTSCLLLSMRDVSTSYTKQDQNTWQLDFEKPLITLNAALAAQTQMGNLLNSLTNGEQIIGQPANSGLAIGGATTVPLATSTVMPMATSQIGPSVVNPGISAASP